MVWSMMMLILNKLVTSIIYFTEVVYKGLHAIDTIYINALTSKRNLIVQVCNRQLFLIALLFFFDSFSLLTGKESLLLKIKLRALTKR